MNEGPGLVGRANPNALFIGAVVAVSTIAIGIGLVVYATAGSGDGASARASATDRTSPTTTTSSTSSTTTTTTSPAGAGAGTGTGAGTGATTTTSTAGDGASPGGGAQQPDLAYSDPTDPPFVGLALPPGITASITPGSCTWTPANGGQLQASGTLTASPTTDDVWFVTVYWLQNERELDEQFDSYDPDPGQTVPWTLTTSAPLPPAEPFRCALEVE